MLQRSSSSSGSPRIFVIDDEWLLAESLAAVLRLHGFQVQAFHNPCQALMRAMENPPDVVITDVMMPGMDGIELALALRQAGHTFQILLISGQLAAVDRVNEARRMGYELEMLEKPVHPMQLLLRLRNRSKRAGKSQQAARPTDSPAASLPRPAA